jgi:hypothetical protein
MICRDASRSITKSITDFPIKYGNFRDLRMLLSQECLLRSTSAKGQKLTGSSNCPFCLSGDRFSAP